MIDLIQFHTENDLNLGNSQYDRLGKWKISNLELLKTHGLEKTELRLFKTSSILIQAPNLVKSAPDICKLGDFLIKYSMEDFAELPALTREQHKLPKFKESMISRRYTLPQIFIYKVNGSNISITKEQYLKAAADRVGGKPLTGSILYSIGGKKHGLKLTPSDIENNQKYLEDYLYEMAKHLVYKDKMDKPYNEAILEFIDEYQDKDFVKFCIDRFGISKQQLCCNHENIDTFSENGDWYNVVGTCNKCLLDMNYSLEDEGTTISLLHEGWEACKQRKESK